MSDEKIEYLFSSLKGFMTDKFNQINSRFDEHEKQQKVDLENLEKRIDKRFKEHEKQQEIEMKQLEERIMQRIEKRFDEHEEKQRLDFARLEHIMYDRTAALFDAREVSLDEDENLYKKLKSLERVLDKHHYRITELESKII